MSSLADRMIDCIRRSNLTREELNRITDNVSRTLTHPKGNELFASYLVEFSDSSACLSVYNTCAEILAEERNRSIRGNLSKESLESLITKVKMMRKTVADMNEIDFRIMKQFKNALETENKEAEEIHKELLEVLESTKMQCQDSLRKMHEEKPEERYIATINRIRDTVRKLEGTLKCSRDLEAARFLRYSTLKSRYKILTDDLRKIKTRNKQMLNLFRQSVTDVQLGSLDILPETLRRQVQKMWHQKYDALLSQNEQLKGQIIAMDCAMKQQQKEGAQILRETLKRFAEDAGF